MHGEQPPPSPDTTASVNVALRTWNVNGRLGDAATVAEFVKPYVKGAGNQTDSSRGDPHDLLSLDGSPDVFVVSLQELVPLTTENVVLSNEQSRQNSGYWESAVVHVLSNVYGQAYESIAARSLVGVFTMVAVKATHIPYISGLHTETLAIGYCGVLANKAVVAIRFRLYASKFLFIGAHLAAGVSKWKDRNDGFHKVLQEFGSTFFPTSPSTTIDRESKESQFLDNFDFVFWIGDLNYRLDGLGKEECFVECERRRWTNLTCFDQLTAQRAKGNAFKGFREGPLDFAPTYKYYPGTAEYDVRHKKKSHTPAWCDRVLWRTRKPLERHVRLESYGTVNLLMSDHMPVGARFAVTISIEDTVDADNDGTDDLEGRPLGFASADQTLYEELLVMEPADIPGPQDPNTPQSQSSWGNRRVHLNQGWLTVEPDDAFGVDEVEIPLGLANVDKLDQPGSVPALLLVVSASGRRSSMQLAPDHVVRTMSVYLGFANEEARERWERALMSQSRAAALSASMVDGVMGGHAKPVPSSCFPPNSRKVLPRLTVDTNAAASATPPWSPAENTDGHVQLIRKRTDWRHTRANFLMTGWLHKRPVAVASHRGKIDSGTFKKRFFVLDFETHKFQYFEGPKCRMCKGTIEIDAASILEITGVTKLRLTTGHGLVLNLRTPSAAALRMWHGGLREVVRMAIVAYDTRHALDGSDTDSTPIPIEGRLASAQSPSFSPALLSSATPTPPRRESPAVPRAGPTVETWGQLGGIHATKLEPQLMGVEGEGYFAEPASRQRLDSELRVAARRISIEHSPALHRRVAKVAATSHDLLDRETVSSTSDNEADDLVTASAWDDLLDEDSPRRANAKIGSLRATPVRQLSGSTPGSPSVVSAASAAAMRRSGGSSTGSHSPSPKRVIRKLVSSNDLRQNESRWKQLIRSRQGDSDTARAILRTRRGSPGRASPGRASPGVGSPGRSGQLLFKEATSNTGQSGR